MMREEIDRYVQGLKEDFLARKMRPKYHFSSPAGWMNDPHAPVWYQGEYHLFFNYYPYEAEGVRPKCWGHAVTKDFTSYRLLPTAIAPDTEHDRDGCASGCAVVYEDKLHLLYTGRNYYRRPREVQCLAVSEDGIHFAKEKRNPVVLPWDCAEADFRDPWVYQKDGLWEMLLGGRKEERPCIYRYQSRELVDWRYAGIFASGGEDQGTMWECPSLVQNEEKTILLVSPEYIDGIRQKSLYFLGKEKDGIFCPEERKEIDYGCDYYAAQFFSSPNGHVFVNGWMNKWDNEHKTKKEGWIGTMTTPRTFCLTQDNKITGEFLSSLKKLRREKEVFRWAELEAGGGYFAAGENSLWVEAELSWDAFQGNCLEMGFLTDETGEKGLRIQFDRRKSALRIENRTVNHEGHDQTLTMPPDFWKRDLHMDILVDVSCVEILISGEWFVTNCVYPDENEREFHYCKIDRRTENLQLTIHHMAPAEFQFEMEA